MSKRKKKNRVVSTEQLESEYRVIAPIAERFCTELTHQINKILDNEQISLGVPIEYRVKKWESLVSKLDRLSLNISTIKDLNDLAGLRLILLFKRDLSKVCELLAGAFKVIDRYDTQERLKEDQFGYSSIHFILELPESWLAVPTMSQMRGLRVEVQVRTVAQHIWAAASHLLQYKKEESVPLELRRAIYRVSALLETVDLEFERVLEQRDTYRNNLSSPGGDAHLNVDLLEEVLDSSLPKANKGSGEEYSDLLSDLLYFDIDTRRKLEALIEKHLPKALKLNSEAVSNELKELEENPNKYPAKYHAYTLRRLYKGGYYYHTGLVRIMLALEFGQKWDNYDAGERHSAQITT
jgi:putative GTP pyrophosphokinase